MDLKQFNIERKVLCPKCMKEHTVILKVEDNHKNFLITKRKEVCISCKHIFEATEQINIGIEFVKDMTNVSYNEFMDEISKFKSEIGYKFLELNKFNSTDHILSIKFLDSYGKNIKPNFNSIYADRPRKELIELINKIEVFFNKIPDIEGLICSKQMEAYRL